jgi:hypothetical protein
MSACQLNEQEYTENKQGDPPVEQAQDQKEQYDRCRKTEKKTLPQSNCGDLPCIPQVDRKHSPEQDQE